MRSYVSIAYKATRIFAIANLANLLISAGLLLASISSLGSIGNLTLVESAGLVIFAGLIDLSSSVGAARFRQHVMGMKDEWSRSKHLEAQQKGAVYLLAGALLFVETIVLALYFLH